MRAPLALAIVCTLLLACGQDRPRPGTFGDSGTAIDAGSTADAATGTDAGPDAVIVDAGPMCEEELVVPYTTRPCSADTKACVEACTEPTCVDACLASDPSTSCTDCVNRALISCFNRNGCQPQWNCYRACSRENCTGVPDVGACLDMHCVEPEQAFYDCVDSIFETSACPSRYADCLPE